MWQGGTERAPELLVLAGEPVGAFAYGLAPGAAEPSPGELLVEFVRSPVLAWPQSGLRGWWRCRVGAEKCVNAGGTRGLPR